MRFVQKSPFRLILASLVLSLLIIPASACQAKPSSDEKTITSVSSSTTVATVATASPSATTSKSTTTAAASTATSGPVKLSGAFTAADLVITVDGQSFALLSDAAVLLQKLGATYQKTEAVSCAYIGFDKTFDYGTMQVFTIPKDKQDLIDGVYLLDNRLKTARGIQVGDTQAAVVAAYGEKSGEGVLVYNKSGDPAELTEPSLTFEVVEGKVSAISYYSASNTHGAASGG